MKRQHYDFTPTHDRIPVARRRGSCVQAQVLEQDHIRTLYRFRYDTPRGAVMGHNVTSTERFEQFFAEVGGSAE